MSSARRVTRRAALGFGLAALATVRVGARAQQAGGPAVWLDMDQAALDAAYDQGAYAPNMDRVLSQHAFMNARAAERLGAPERFSYGDAPIEALDVYRARTVDAPVLVFLHGGTWRFGRAGNYAYIAEPFVRAGAHVVVPDFSPVDEVDGGLTVLVRQVRTAVAWVYENAAGFGGDASRIHVAGHSSGGHLAAAVLTTDWQGDYGLPASLVRGGICISGMFDVKPVRLSWRNEYLGLDDAGEQALSPQRHLAHLHAPVIVAYGTAETPEFQRQSRDFAAAVRAAGKPVELLVAESFNHFEILTTLANPYGVVGGAAFAQMGLSAA